MSAAPSASSESACTVVATASASSSTLCPYAIVCLGPRASRVASSARVCAKVRPQSGAAAQRAEFGVETALGVRRQTARRPARRAGTRRRAPATGPTSDAAAGRSGRRLRRTSRRTGRCGRSRARGAPPRCRPSPSRSCRSRASRPDAGETAAGRMQSTAAVSSTRTFACGQRSGWEPPVPALVDEDDVARRRDLPEQLVELGQLVARCAARAAFQIEERAVGRLVGGREASRSAARSGVRPGARVLRDAEPPAARGHEPHRARRQLHRAVARPCARDSRAQRPPRPPRPPARARRAPPAGSARSASRARCSPGAAAREAPTERRRAYRPCDDGQMSPRSGNVGERRFGVSWPGLAAGALAVAVVTVVIWGLKPYVPVLSLGALYVLGVLPIALFWGLPYAVAVSVASMLAFNWFFLPPVHTFTLADSRNWFALGVFVVTGVVVSELAARMRRQARRVRRCSPRSRRRCSSTATSARELERDRRRGRPRARGRARDDRARRRDRRRQRPKRTRWAPGAAGWGRSTSPAGAAAAPAARRRLLPALASLLGVAIDRERLAGEALEAEALRRSDAIKTALLRAVSHDLRTPLMAISTSASALAQRRPRARRGRPRRPARHDPRRGATGSTGSSSNLLDLSRLQAGAAAARARARGRRRARGRGAGRAGRRRRAGRGRRSPTSRRPSSVDAHQIQRVLVNLIENALKYSPPDEPVHVRVAVTSSRGRRPRHRPGPGVSPRASSERIFEPFQRGSGSATRPRRGARPRDRAGLRRGERRADLGRVPRPARARRSCSRCRRDGVAVEA